MLHQTLLHLTHSSFHFHYSEGKLLATDSGYMLDAQTGRLTIKLASKSDSGLHTCVVSTANNLTVEGTIDLTIGSK